jgi:hypothetical protein
MRLGELANWLEYVSQWMIVAVLLIVSVGAV